MKTLEYFQSIILFLILGSSSASALEFEITFVDPDRKYTSYYPVIESHIKAAGAEWAKHIKSNVLAETFVSFFDFPNTNGAAAGGSREVPLREEGGITITESSIAHKIKTGIDFYGSSSDLLTADISLIINQNLLVSNGFNFDPDPFNDESGHIDNGKSDFKNIMMHEIGHALGFRTNGFNADGSPFLTFPVRNLYDQLIIFQNDNYFFTGSRAINVYGGSVPLHYQSQSHLGNYDRGDGRPGTEFSHDVMFPSESNGRKMITPLHVAILADLGYPIKYVSNDFSGDRKSDIFWRNSTSNNNKIYLMNGNVATTDTNVNLFLNNPAWEVVGNSDFNKDGKSDLLWRNSDTGLNYISIMNGTTTSTGSYLTIPAFVDSEWKIAGVGDFDNDGNDDIFWHHDSGENRISFLDGTNYVSTVSVNTISDPRWKVAGITDFNNDGKDDVLWRNSANRRVWLYLMNGRTINNGAGAGEHVAFTSENWDIEGVADFDADGRGDILWKHNSNGRVWMYLMDGPNVSNGTTQSPGQHVAYTSLNWEIQALGDYNGDGKQDIFWRNNVTGQNHMYLMNGPTLIQTGGSPVNTLSDLNWTVQSK